MFKTIQKWIWKFIVEFIFNYIHIEKHMHPYTYVNTTTYIHTLMLICKHTLIPRCWKHWFIQFKFLHLVSFTSFLPSRYWINDLGCCFDVSNFWFVAFTPSSLDLPLIYMFFWIIFPSPSQMPFVLAFVQHLRFATCHS